MFPIITSIVVLTFISISGADAGAGARASNTTAQSLSTISFKVAAESTTGGTSTGIQTFTSGANNANFFFYYRNTGTINANAFTWTITHTVGTGGNTLKKCPLNTTFSSPTLCSDSSSPTTLTLTGTGPALTTGQWLPVYLKIVSKNDVFTAASTIARSQIRVGTNTTA